MRIRSTILSLILIQILAVSAVAASRSFIPCDCNQQPCTCFVQLGDEGGFVKRIVELLIDQGYLASNVPTGLFSEDVEAAVIEFQIRNNLPQTGTMDDDTLTLLIWGMLPEKLDKAFPIVSGEPKTYPDQVFIPTDGGKKRHHSKTCSNMYDPRKVSIRNAAQLGFDACGKCAKKKEEHMY